MKCRNCGSELEPGARFCRDCGTKAPVMNETPKFCRECGARLEENARFCTNCGAKVIRFPRTFAEQDPPSAGPEQQKSASAAEPQFADMQKAEQEHGPKEPQENAWSTAFWDADISNGASKEDTAEKIRQKLRQTKQTAENKFLVFWKKQDNYGRIMFIYICVLAVLTVTAFCMGRTAAGIISIVQTELAAVSWMMRTGIIKGAEPGLPVCLIAASAGMLLLYFLLFGVGRSDEKPKPSQPSGTMSEYAGITDPDETEEGGVSGLPAIQHSPEMYFGTWTFSAMETDGALLTNEELVESGDTSMDTYRVLFREDGSGTVLRESGDLDFHWKMAPYGVVTETFTAYAAENALCIVDENKKLYLEKTSDSFLVTPEASVPGTVQTEQPPQTIPETIAAATVPAAESRPSEASTEPSAGPTETTEDHSVCYSSNDDTSVRNGSTGVYAYIREGPSYDQYVIIDFDSRFVYKFLDGEEDTTCDRVSMDSGTLNDVLSITYHEGDTQWSYGLHFKYRGNPEHLILKDNDGFEYDYYPTDLSAAEAIRNSREIRTY